MRHDGVQAWLDAYVAAWRTYDPAEISALFSENATYAYHPWDERGDLVRGRTAIVDSWLKERDEPGSWEARYRTLLVEGERAVATGFTRYSDGEFYWNLWILRFDEQDRCTEFVEWYMLEPEEKAPQ